MRNRPVMLACGESTLAGLGRLVVAALVLCTGWSRAVAQSDNPVYVDDSPQAWETFRQAQDQARNNAGEAVRLYQELLDEFAMKIIPAAETESDHFKAVRQRVHDALSGNPALLERYMLIQTPQAETLLQDGDLERLAITRALTEPGLEAMLRLAQVDLESGRFATALAWLHEALNHPKIDDRRAAHAWFMIGLAEHDLGHAAPAQAALDALGELGAAA